MKQTAYWDKTLPAPSTAVTRLSASILIVVLAFPGVVFPVRELRTNYWLLRDGKRGVAVVLKDHLSHGRIEYRYRVNQHVYTGQDIRSWQNPKYANVTAGEESIVYFSSSHPWLSAINLPRGVMFEGLPVVLFIWLILVGLIIAAVKPSSNWALDFSGQRGLLQTLFPQRRASDSPFRDKLKLVGWGLLIVLFMVAIVVVVNTRFGPPK